MYNSEIIYITIDGINSLGNGKKNYITNSKFILKYVLKESMYVYSTQVLVILLITGSCLLLGVFYVM